MISVTFVVGVIVTSILVLACMGGFVFWRVLVRERDQDSWIAFAISSVALAITLGLAAWGFYPYDMQYHRYTHIEGTVDAIEARMLADGESTTQQYAVRFREDGATYKCEDTRCALLKPGDTLALWCIREYQYASTHGWRCRFDRTERPA